MYEENTHISENVCMEFNQIQLHQYFRQTCNALLTLLFSTQNFCGTNQLFQGTAEQLTLVVSASRADSECPSARAGWRWRSEPSWEQSGTSCAAYSAVCSLAENHDPTSSEAKFRDQWVRCPDEALCRPEQMKGGSHLADTVGLVDHKARQEPSVIEVFQGWHEPAAGADLGTHT